MFFGYDYVNNVLTQLAYGGKGGTERLDVLPGEVVSLINTPGSRRVLQDINYLTASARNQLGRLGALIGYGSGESEEAAAGISDYAYLLVAGIQFGVYCSTLDGWHNSPNVNDPYMFIFDSVTRTTQRIPANPELLPSIVGPQIDGAWGSGWQVRHCITGDRLYRFIKTSSVGGWAFHDIDAFGYEFKTRASLVAPTGGWRSNNITSFIPTPKGCIALHFDVVRCDVNYWNKETNLWTGWEAVYTGRTRCSPSSTFPEGTGVGCSKSSPGEYVDIVAQQRVGGANALYYYRWAAEVPPDTPNITNLISGEAHDRSEELEIIWDFKDPGDFQSSVRINRNILGVLTYWNGRSWVENEGAALNHSDQRITILENWAPANGDVSFRVQVKDNNDTWSGYSEWVTIYADTADEVTITFPVANSRIVNEAPRLSWRYPANSEPASYRIKIYERDGIERGSLVHDSEDRRYESKDLNESYVIPDGLINGNYIGVVTWKTRSGLESGEAVVNFTVALKEVRLPNVSVEVVDKDGNKAKGDIGVGFKVRAEWKDNVSPEPVRAFLYKRLSNNEDYKLLTGDEEFDELEDEGIPQYSTGPVAISARGGTRDIVIYTTRNLNRNIIPSLGSFDVLVDDGHNQATAISIQGSLIYLTLSNDILKDQEVFVSYTKPVQHPIVDLGGNELAEFENIPVGHESTATNFSITLDKYEVNNRLLTITASEELNVEAIPSELSFVVKKNGNPITITNVNIVGTQIFLTLGESIISTDAVRLSYTIPDLNYLRGLDDNGVRALAETPVTNSTPAGPVPESVIGTYHATWQWGIRVNFSSAIRVLGNINTDRNAYTAEYKVGEVWRAVSITNVLVIEGYVFILYSGIDSSVRNREWRISYTKPANARNRLQDASGREAASFTIEGGTQSQFFSSDPEFYDSDPIIPSPSWQSRAVATYTYNLDADDDVDYVEWIDEAVVSDIDYEYSVIVVGSNNSRTQSAWTLSRRLELDAVRISTLQSTSGRSFRVSKYGRGVRSNIKQSVFADKSQKAIYGYEYLEPARIEFSSLTLSDEKWLENRIGREFILRTPIGNIDRVLIGDLSVIHLSTNETQDPQSDGPLRSSLELVRFLSDIRI